MGTRPGLLATQQGSAQTHVGAKHVDLSSLFQSKTVQHVWYGLEMGASMKKGVSIYKSDETCIG